MVISAALTNGYVFMVLIGILTSVISGVYYLSVIKNLFFYNPDLKVNSVLAKINLIGNITQNYKNNEKDTSEEISFKINNVTISSALSITISVLTLILLLFILIPNELFTLANISTIILFKA